MLAAEVRRLCPASYSFSILKICSPETHEARIVRLNE